MTEKRIDVDLTDYQSEGQEILNNIFNPERISVLISRVKDPHEKRSLEELVLEFIEGR